MAIVAGIDEAGYGPYLGPLVVSAAAFRVPPALAEADLWRALRSGVAARRGNADGRVVIADSKALYTSGRGLDTLEEGALSALAAAGGTADSLWALLGHLGAAQEEEYQPYPWYAEVRTAVPLPAATTAERIESRARRLGRALARCRAAVVALRSVPLLEGRFNRILDRTRNKSEVAFSAVGFLIRRLREAFPGEVIHLTVDKQGGRNHYLHVLTRCSPEADIEVRSETGRVSKYVLREPLGKTELVFRMEADADFLPVALASMVSKYVRELFMGCVNRYWQARIEGLQRTSGYPADARRFIKALEGAGAFTTHDRRMVVRKR